MGRAVGRLPWRTRLPLLLAAAGAGLPATAQSIARVDQAIAAQNTILQRFTPPPRVGTVDITVEDNRRRTTDAEAERQRFRLRAVSVVGAATLPPEALAPIWRDRIGSEVSVADLYRIAEAIDAAYLQAGYFSMTVVPVQDFASGRVTIRVYESYVATVEITTEIPGMERRLQPYIDRIVAMRPIRIKEAERILSLMSDLGGLEIEGTFVRPEVPTGGGSLKLDVGFDRVAGMIGFDNLGSSAVGPLELSASVAISDMLGLFETTTLVAVTVPDTPRELALLRASQDFPIGHDGLTAGYAFTYLGIEPGASLRPLDIETERTLGTAYVSYPFLRTLDHNLSGRLEVNAQNDVLDIGGARVDQSQARWLVASLSTDHALDDGSIAGGFGVAQGLDDDPRRSDVPSGYRFVTADLAYTRALGEKTTLSLRAAGQYASTPLPGAVQFAIGGDVYGLAFDGASVEGDCGAATIVELIRDIETDLPALDNLSISALADYGVVWNNGDSRDFVRDAIGSVGIGLNGVIGQKLTFQLLAAAPWDAGDTVQDPGTRLFFRLGWPL